MHQTKYLLYILQCSALYSYIMLPWYNVGGGQCPFVAISEKWMPSPQLFDNLSQIH